MALSNQEIEQHVHLIVEGFMKQSKGTPSDKAAAQAISELVINVLQNLNDIAENTFEHV